MAEYYNPYKEAEKSLYSNPYSAPQVTTTTNALVAEAQIAASTGMFAGKSPEQVMQRAESGISPEVFREQSQSTTAMIQEQRKQLTEKLLKDPENAEQHKLEAQTKVDEQYKSLADNTIGKYYDLVIQDPEIKDQPEIMKRNAAANLYMLHSVAELADGVGIADFAWDILVPNVSWNTAEFLNKFDSKNKLDAYVNSAEYIHEFAKKYNALDPEQKVEVLDAIIKELPSITSNEQRQIGIIMSAVGKKSLAELQSESFWDKFGLATEVVAAPATIGKAIVNGGRAFNTVKTLTKAGNTKVAGLAADEILKNPNKAKLFGISADEAALSADPRQTEALMEITGLNATPGGVATNVRNMLASIDQVTDEALNITNQGLGLGDAEKMARAEADVTYFRTQKNITNVVAEDFTDTGFVLKYDTLDEKGRTVLHTSEKRPYVIDDVTGTFLEKEAPVVSTTPLLRSIIGAGTKAGKDKNRLLYAYEQIDFASRKVANYLSESLNVATKGLNKKSVEKLNYILEKGDDAERVYTYDELVNAGIGGVRFTDKEYAAYVGTRKVMDNLHSIKDAQIRRDLVTQGVKDIWVDDVVYKAKPYDSVDSAVAAFDNLDGMTIRIPDPIMEDHAAGIARGITREELVSYYDEGYKLVRSSDSNVGDMFPSEAVGHSKWALVHGSDIRNISGPVLNKRTGYIPRVYENSNYFVKKKNHAMVDGDVVQHGVSTLRYFGNIDDAEKYIKKLEDAADMAGDTSFDRSMYEVVADRAMTAEGMEGEIIGQWGGLYSGYRKDEAIKYGLDGVDGARVSAIESIQDYMQHVSTRYPMSQYRMGMEQRLINQAKRDIPELANRRVSFAELKGVIEASKVSNQQVKKKLLDAHDQITFMNRTPTLGEEQTAGTFKKIGDWMSRYTVGGKQPLKWASTSVSNLHKSDPVAALRTSAFHLYLGAFNASQLFVQGMGATVAMSIHPIYAAKGMTKLPALTMLDNIKDLTAKRTAIKMLAKKTGYDIEEAYAAWQKSGLQQSALVTNADAYTMYNGLPISNGNLRKLADKGTMFFTAGELANLRISFLTSYEKWKDLNKGKALTDTGLKTILSDTEKFRLHMTSANKGDFQKGIMSLPTQFQQINVRYMEAFLGKELTLGEKARLGIGQAALFGAAGVPFGSWATEGLLNTLGVDPLELDESRLIAAQRGVIGWLLNDYFDIDAVFTSRVAIGAGLTDALSELLAGDTTSLPDLLLGPVGGIVDNVSKSISDAAFARNGVISSEDMTLEDYGLVTGAFMQSIAQVPSSTRNLLKAYYLKTAGVHFDKQGNHVMATDPTTKNVIAQALGFGSQDIADFWDMTIDNRKTALVKAEAVNLVMRGYNRMFSAALNNDVQEQRAFELMLKSTYSMFPDPVDRQEILEAVLNRLKSPTNRVDQEVVKFLQYYGTEIGKSANELNPLINKYLAEREATAGNL